MSSVNFRSSKMTQKLTFTNNSWTSGGSTFWTSSNGVERTRGLLHRPRRLSPSSFSRQTRTPTRPSLRRSTSSKDIFRRGKPTDDSHCSPNSIAYKNPKPPRVSQYVISSYLYILTRMLVFSKFTDRSS